jgi:hypothetical protein
MWLLDGATTRVGPRTRGFNPSPATLKKMPRWVESGWVFFRSARAVAWVFIARATALPRTLRSSFSSDLSVPPGKPGLYGSRTMEKEWVRGCGTTCRITSRKWRSWKILRLCWNPICSVNVINDPNCTFFLVTLPKASFDHVVVKCAIEIE